MSSVVETSVWGFLHSLRSVEMTEKGNRSNEMTVSVNMYIITYYKRQEGRSTKGSALKIFSKAHHSSITLPESIYISPARQSHLTS